MRGVLRHVERGQRGLGGGAVFKRGQIQHQAKVFAVRPARLLVEALAGLVAQPFALHQLVRAREQNLPCDTPCGKLAATWARMSMPDQVGQAEGSGARPAEGRAGERVNFFDGQALLQHQVGGRRTSRRCRCGWR